jgi:hypothetical protein
MTQGGEFRIVFDAMDQASGFAQKTAGQIQQQADDSVAWMAQAAGDFWDDDAGHENHASYGLVQKHVNEHTDQLHREGTSFTNVGHIGQNTRSAAMNAVRL